MKYARVPKQAISNTAPVLLPTVFCGDVSSTHNINPAEDQGEITRLLSDVDADFVYLSNLKNIQESLIDLDHSDARAKSLISHCEIIAHGESTSSSLLDNQRIYNGAIPGQAISKIVPGLDTTLSCDDASCSGKERVTALSEFKDPFFEVVLQIDNGALSGCCCDINGNLCSTCTKAIENAQIIISDDHLIPENMESMLIDNTLDPTTVPERNDSKGQSQHEDMQISVGRADCRENDVVTSTGKVLSGENTSKYVDDYNKLKDAVMELQSDDDYDSDEGNQSSVDSSDDEDDEESSESGYESQNSNAQGPCKAIVESSSNPPETIRCDIDDTPQLPDISAFGLPDEPVMSSSPKADRGMQPEQHTLSEPQHPAEPNIINSVGRNGLRISADAVNEMVQRYNSRQTPEYETIFVDPKKKIIVEGPMTEDGRKPIDFLPRKRKYHLCIYCFKDTKKLKDHLLIHHKNELLVVEMRNLSKANPGSREPMKELINLGDYIYNTDFERNNGTLRVVRSTQYVRRADQFMPCTRCRGMIFEKDYTKHLQLCLNQKVNGARIGRTLGRRAFLMCSSNAGQRMRENILPNMRRDSIFKAIRYDELIIEYGNCICLHLRGAQHNKNIYTQLRRLARLKIELKEKKFVDIIVCSRSREILRAIEVMAGVYENGSLLRYPTVAQNMFTLVKAIATTHMINLYETGQKDAGDHIRIFIDCLSLRYTEEVSDMAAKSHSLNRDTKKVQMPSDDDLCSLLKYTRSLRIESYQKLYKDEQTNPDKFDEKALKTLMQATLTTLQVCNTRRPGDVERIRIENYENIERFHDKPMFQELSGDCQALTREYGIMKVLGKKGQTVKVLVSHELQLCIDMILRHRSKLDISPKNRYLFGLPKTLDYEIRHLSAYAILCRFAVDCGALHPETLRATKLRKRLATACLKLNLTDAELSDLARYMGHHKDIHNKHYRQHIAERDIAIFKKFFVTECGEDKQLSSLATTKDFLQENGVVHQNSSIVNTSTEHEESDITTRKRPAEDVLESSVKKLVKRKQTWLPKEKDIVHEYFPNYMNGSTTKLPSLAEIRNMMAENKDYFINRTADGIKIWMRQNV